MSRFLLLILLLGLHQLATAQRYYGISKEEFGKSKIQNKTFQWRTFSSANFEYNFYRGGEQIARNAATNLEKKIKNITGTLGYTPYETTKIFIFNSLADIKSTNLSGGQSFATSGTIIDTKNARILTTYEKNDSLFLHKLVQNVTNIYVYDMLYGGNMRESLESQILLHLPEWFTSGIAAYIAEPDNSAKYDHFKTTILEAQNKRLSSLKGEEATLVGQSIWHYLGLKYGKDNISNILNLTRIIRDEQSSITSTLGVSFQKFIKDWRDFYILGQNVEEKPKASEEPLIVKEIPKRILDLADGEVDTDNYQFDEKNIQAYLNQKNTAPTTTSNRSSGSIAGNTSTFGSTKLFKNFLISDKRSFDVVVDPVRGFGVGYNVAFRDILQNNEIKFSSYFKPSSALFRTYDYSLSYGYYAKKTDFVFSYEKRSVDLETIQPNDAFLFRPLNHLVSKEYQEYLGLRLASQRIAVKIIYPFSNTFKLEIIPAVIKNDAIDYSLSREKGIDTDFYIAPKFNLVFDNSRTNIYGVEQGTKAKLSFDRFFHTSNNLKSFQSYYLDIRHYQRLVKGLQLAGRFSYGVSSGNSPQYTYLGGAESSINRSYFEAPETAVIGKPDYKNILFYNFPGNLRGFDFGRLYGNSHILANIELRSHLAEYLPQMAKSSSFIRNLQLVGFYDIGTAWIGSKGPFSRQNSLNTVITGSGAFIAEVTNFKNPFLSGVGVGIRSSILGFFVRADYAYGIEDGDFRPAKFHISIGKDF